MSLSLQQPAAEGQPCQYHTINISGNAQAILGNAVNYGPNFYHDSNVDWKNTLKTLYFEGMRTRKAQIDKRASSPEYVEWVWTTSFTEWLSNDESYFWITGRAGSGKSTLMKHIADSRKTKQYLQRSGKEWAVIHFFFDFRAATTTANNLEGMLRSLLIQLLKQRPGLAARIHFTFTYDVLDLDPVACLDYVCQAAEAASFGICAFIDGLDEFEGSGADLVETLHSLQDRTGFKLCFASRPYQIFETNFCNYPNLVMQDHNDGSIKMYANARWRSERLGLQAGLPNAFTDRICEKASGVFLWARLATDELLQDLLRGKSIVALQNQLDEMPKEVEDMYQRILDRVPHVMRFETAMLLHMISSSTSHSAQTKIWRLYTVIDAYATQNASEDTVRVLPVALDDEPGLEARIMNVLGDFVDISHFQERPNTYLHSETVPKFVIRNNEVVRQEASSLRVSLIHETLGAFFRGNAWLMKHICIELQAVPPERLWINIYLNEMEKASSNDLLIDNCVLVRQFVQEMYTLFLEKRGTETDRMSGKLLNILRGWSQWTPLLLLAIQDMFSLLDCLEVAETRRLGRLLKNHIMHYHWAICIFQTYNRAAVIARESKTWAAFNYFFSLSGCGFSIFANLHDSVDYIGLDNLLCTCHVLPDVALQPRLWARNQDIIEAPGGQGWVDHFATLT